MKTTLITAISLSLFAGYMIGASMDPIDRALRNAQRLNRSNLAGITSFRNSSEMTISQRIQTDSAFSNEYVKRVDNSIAQKEKAVRVLEDTQNYIDLAKQEVMIGNSLQKYLVTLSRIQIENGQIYHALTNLHKAEEIIPADLSAVRLLSSAYMSLYKLLPDNSEKIAAGDNAVFYLRMVLRENPDDADALYGLALIYTDQGVYRDALGMFARILDKNPENIDALLGTARIYYDMGDTGRARRIYEQTEALILELQSGRARYSAENSILNSKLRVIRNNLGIIYNNQNTLGN